ncbi:AMIN-like domain-containing (lipo)protein [Crossiella sp. CA198]|uniref:AMIN-like domain-containing (lipo)protein n=1 Tax=Crossiella sp. CA198 TaxID=3455607 RepID=UPI003F8D444F
MVLRRLALLLAALAAMALTAPLTASATPGYCGLAWGSTDKHANPTTTAELTNIRAGRQDCFDRLVIDLRGVADGYTVRYVPEMTEDPTGNPVPLRGGAILSVKVDAPAYDEHGNLTYHPANRAELVNVTGYQTFRQVAWAGSFEGQTLVGLGVRARLPFRVFTLPNRVVVDVAHFW